MVHRIYVYLSHCAIKLQHEAMKLSKRKKSKEEKEKEEKRKFLLRQKKKLMRHKGH
ncbi:DUF2992 family protein [Clostridium pasteurianum]|uniref:DUF2992 family protein n=1 Tax=Clostridium pasteurianum TaxID=1501 RepID=UPI0002A747DB|nr:DUF2992 family protein [Clostridium pasteurianum]ELP61048.1 hypothetical protein F502_01285 [Clostridium pasteurianum DSM 525 = ATCC 6013]UZW14654.1 DUF2992 family protein [Clostridium pasteurianum]